MTAQYFFALLVWFNHHRVTSSASLSVRSEYGRADIPQIFHAKELKGKDDDLFAPRDISGQKRVPIDKGLWGKRYIAKNVPSLRDSVRNTKADRVKKTAITEERGLLKYHIIPTLEKSRRELGDFNNIVASSSDTVVPIDKGLWGRRDSAESYRGTMGDVRLPNDVLAGELAELGIRHIVLQDKVPREESKERSSAVFQKDLRERKHASPESLQKGLWGKRDYP